MYPKIHAVGSMVVALALAGLSLAQTLPTAGTSRSFSFLGFPTRILISGADTGGASTLLEIKIPSNAGPPAHIHSREDEVYFIRSGTFQFLMDGVCLEAGPGTSVYMPKGHFHTFKNISKQAGEQLMFVYPAGIEQFFWEVHELALKMPQDFPKLNELANSKYGINLVPDHDFHAHTCKTVKAPK
jgi:mannose-6-phosphate isomerase-like protein (cupin superfamily)